MYHATVTTWPAVGLKITILLLFFWKSIQFSKGPLGQCKFCKKQNGDVDIVDIVVRISRNDNSWHLLYSLSKSHYTLKCMRVYRHHTDDLQVEGWRATVTAVIVRQGVFVVNQKHSAIFATSITNTTLCFNSDKISRVRSQK